MLYFNTVITHRSRFHLKHTLPKYCFKIKMLFGNFCNLCRQLLTSTNARCSMRLKYLQNNIGPLFFRFHGMITLTSVNFPQYRSAYCNSNQNKKENRHLGHNLNHRVKNGDKKLSFQTHSTNLENSVSDHHFLPKEKYSGHGRKVYFETYGCQMNVNDTEIVWALLAENGFRKTNDITQSDVILLMTCAVREGAEQKIWKRIEYLKHLKKKRHRQKNQAQLRIGILGCMAEHLKRKIVEKEKMVDLVCGPDAYRDLPRMLALTTSGQTSVNVLLSLDETYAEVVPVRLNSDSPTAFVSIMRGCDNMCSYCIVPFTRGRERSRAMKSILEEVTALSNQGVKEVTLLGQNVNSYRDMSEMTSYTGIDYNTPTNLSQGFKTIYKPKIGGKRFSELLDEVSAIDPEMRIRFTSPHPKDFPNEVLDVIKGRHNICHHIQLPAQSGSTRILEAMRRGYTREVYLDLVRQIRHTLPDASLSSDFIAGFCGETEEDHQETLSLIREVQYNFAFCFPYSRREKTHAYYHLEDNVPQDVKSRRHMELADVFREEVLNLHKSQIGHKQLILVEGTSKRSAVELVGRNDHNTKVIIPAVPIPDSPGSTNNTHIEPGDYIVVQIQSATSQTLKATPLCHTTLEEFSVSRRVAL